MMVDVDVLTRRFGNLIATHCAIAQAFRNHDITYKPTTYEKDTFTSHATSQLSVATLSCKAVPILSSSIITLIPDIMSLDGVLEPVTSKLDALPVTNTNASMESNALLVV